MSAQFHRILDSTFQFILIAVGQQRVPSLCIGDSYDYVENKCVRTLKAVNFDRSSLYVTVRMMRGNRCFMSFVGYSHRVGRVLSFFSSRRNWNSPNPSPAGECAFPLWFWRERGWESPNSHEGTYTVVLYYIYELCGYTKGTMLLHNVAQHNVNVTWSNVTKRSCTQHILHHT